MSPGAGVGERERGEAGGFGGRDAKQAQHGLGELIDGCLVDAFGVTLALAQQAEQAARYGAEGDLGVSDGEAPGVLACFDVAEGAGGQPGGDYPGGPARRR